MSPSDPVPLLETYKSVLKQMILEEGAGLSPFYSQLHRLDNLPLEIYSQFVRHLASRLGPHMPPTSVFNTLDSIVKASTTTTTTVHDEAIIRPTTTTDSLVLSDMGTPLLSTTEHIDLDNYRTIGDKAPRLFDVSLPNPKKVVKFSESLEVLPSDKSDITPSIIDGESPRPNSGKADNIPSALVKLYDLQERLKKEEEHEQMLDEKISTYKYEAKGWQSRYDALMADFKKEEVQLLDVGFQMKKDILNVNRDTEKLINQKRRAEIEKERLSRLASKAGVVIGSTPVKKPINEKRRR